MNLLLKKNEFLLLYYSKLSHFLVKEFLNCFPLLAVDHFHDKLMEYLPKQSFLFDDYILLSIEIDN